MQVSDSVAGFIAWSNVTVISLVTETPLVLFAGTVLTTVGGLPIARVIEAWAVLPEAVVRVTVSWQFGVVVDGVNSVVTVV
ncbi:MAG: hypothetical protein QW570_08015 [Candidatus Caldarchaeum sp.]